MKSWVFIVGGANWVVNDLRDISREFRLDSRVLSFEEALSPEYISAAHLILVADESKEGARYLQELWVRDSTHDICWGVYVNKRPAHFVKLPTVVLSNVRSIF